MNLIGLGSFINHASYTKFGNLLDHMLVPPFLGLVATYGLSDLFLEELNDMEGFEGLGDKLSGPIAIFSFILFQVISFLNEYYQILDVVAVFALLVGMVLLTVAIKVGLDERFWHLEIAANNIEVVYAVIALLLGAASYEFIVPVPCWPKSFISFHSLWHFFTSVAGLLFVDFFFTEREHNNNFTRIVHHSE